MKHFYLEFTAMRAIIRTITLPCIVVLLAACVHAEPANLRLLKNDIRQWQQAGLYEQELTSKITEAQTFIDQQAHDNARKAHQKRLAVVLDIDETSLSNYPFMDSIDFAEDKTLVENHMLAADAPAIRPMLAFYQEAQRLHIAVFFVTGRNIRFQSATETNLKQAGYDHWAGLYLKTTPQATIAFKSQARADIEHNGYTIIANLGDQYSDLIGGHAEKTFKLPNPFYYIP